MAIVRPAKPLETFEFDSPALNVAFVDTKYIVTLMYNQYLIRWKGQEVL